MCYHKFISGTASVTSALTRVHFTSLDYGLLCNENVQTDVTLTVPGRAIFGVHKILPITNNSVAAIVWLDYLGIHSIYSLSTYYRYLVFRY